MRQRPLLGLVALVVAAAMSGCATSGRPVATPHTGATTSVTPTPTPSPPPATTSPASTSPTSSPSPRPTSSGPTSSTLAPTGIPLSLIGKEWSVIPTTRHIVALTFDAGANDAGLASILATLRRTGTAATFFLTGDWVATYPAQARVVCNGFRVGNHSLTHPYFTQLSQSQIAAQVLDAAAKIRTVCGANPAPLFRFPFGDRDQRTITAVNTLGYIPIRWTVDSLGWQGTSGGRSVASVLARILDNAQPGEIVLMHVGSHPTDHSTLDADALPQVIDQLRARGYAFVTLDALLTS